MVNKVTWQRAGRVTEPGRYMLRYGWLTVTAEDLAIWRQFPDAAFTLVKLPSDPDAPEEFHLGAFELPTSPTITSKFFVCAFSLRRRCTRLNQGFRSKPRCSPHSSACRSASEGVASMARGGRGARENRGVCAALVCRGRRPRTVDPAGFDGLDHKSLPASPQRHRALPPQPPGIDDGSRTPRGRRPGGHDQRRALAIVRQRLCLERLGDEGATGGLHHAAMVIA